MAMGQAYADVLSPLQQQALEHGATWLIDNSFDDLQDADHWRDDVEAFDQTLMATHLPPRYLPKYTVGFAPAFSSVS
jgi:hypothetical protein